MPRKLRLEYPGACYHVINRGNYRGDVFQTDGAKSSFEECLFEACVKSGWVLHAFVVMRNHYHLALETPASNLVKGMQWLQATFANRFNHLRGERGHLPQGRCKALVVEDGATLGQLCDYIHFNPVRAGVQTVVQLGTYRFSSYWYLQCPTERPPFLHLVTALTEAGELADTPAGWRSYDDFLTWQAEEGPAGKGKAYVCLSRGWALGTREFKQALAQEHAVAVTARAWTTGGAQELREIRWQELLEQGLKALGKTAAEVSADPKSAPWKLALAAWLKAWTQVVDRWLSEQLKLGAPAALRRYLTIYRRQPTKGNELWKRLESISAV